MTLYFNAIEVRLEARYRQQELQVLCVTLADQLHPEGFGTRIQIGIGESRVCRVRRHYDRDMSLGKPVRLSGVKGSSGVRACQATSEGEK